jgi:hypothetical protein
MSWLQPTLAFYITFAACNSSVQRCIHWKKYSGHTRGILVACNAEGIFRSYFGMFSEFDMLGMPVKVFMYRGYSMLLFSDFCMPRICSCMTRILSPVVAYLTFHIGAFGSN